MLTNVNYTYIFNLFEFIFFRFSHPREEKKYNKMKHNEKQFQEEKTILFLEIFQSRFYLFITANPVLSFATIENNKYKIINQNIMKVSKKCYTF